MKERFLLTISFILCIFSGWALVQAQPVEDFQFTNETYNSSDWDTLFQNSLSSSNLSSWNANVYDNYLELQAAWEENIDSQIDSYLFSVFQSDDYNPNENYLDYALTYLNSKKETSFLEWETSTLSRIETERTNYLNLISGYNLSDPLQTLWNDWVGSFENHLEVGMGEFNSALTELNENYNEILNEIQTTDQNFLVNEYRISEYENLVRNAVQGQLNSLKVHVLTNSLLQQKYNFLDDKGNLLPQFQYNGDLFKFSNSDITKDWGLQDYLDDYTKLKDSKFGLKSLIAGQWGQDFVENNSHDYLLNSNGKELFNLINELEQGLENKLPLSEISNKLNDYFKTQKQSAEQLTSYYNSRIYTDINTSDPNSINYLTMPVSDYKLTIGKNFNPLQPEQNPTLDLSKIIREYIDGGRQDSSTLINFLNSTLASPTLSVTDLTDVDLIAYTDPSRLYTNWNMISLDRLGGKYTPDNFDRPEGDSPLFELIQFRTDGTHFYSYEYVVNLCWGYCVGSSESIDEDLVIISLKYKIKNKNALEMRNTWNDYTRDLSSQITLWEDSINPSLSTWETKVSEYKKQWEDWKTRKLTLLSQAEDELAVQTQEILNKRDTWINNSYEYFQNNFQSDNPENQFNYESIDLSTVNKELEKTTKNFGNFKDVSKANFHSKETETDLFVYIENSLSGISNFSYAESITEGLKSTENSIISSYADSLRNTRTLKDGLNQDQLSIFNKKIFEEKYINSLCGKSSEYNLSYNESDTIISCSNGSKKELKNSLAGLCINEDQNKSRC
ncbi:MAG: TIGR04388 family protein, partial [Leptospiraceae bacterium]|nr:TIGR04388 family protein [Leptospiraceae bacterium]